MGKLSTSRVNILGEMVVEEKMEGNLISKENPSVKKSKNYLHVRRLQQEDKWNVELKKGVDFCCRYSRVNKKHGKVPRYVATKSQN